MQSISKEKIQNDVVCQFYGASASNAFSESVLRLRKSHKEQKEKSLPAVFKSRLDGPSTTWKIFSRLSEAITYSDAYAKDCMVFSFEKRVPENTGQRMFLVAHPQHLWLNHKSRKTDERCSYEVIKENEPCKLYYDLEFNKNLNPGKDGNKLVKIFIQCSIAALYEDYSLNYEISDFLWLDSSTSQKFSCHLILQMKNIAFEDNLQVGNFVSSLISKIQERAGMNKIADDDMWPNQEELISLFILNSENEKMLFCDQAVYSKNRNFRLFLSTKYGKRAPLYLSCYNEYGPKAIAHIDENEIIFYDSLITYFRQGKPFSRVLKAEESSVLSKHSQSQRKNQLSGFSQSGPSPYPEVDNFLLSIIRDDFQIGFIRKWTYLESQNVLVYEIGNYRYCCNIGRHHKSNNIMIIVDMKKRIFYQKCHDPDCHAQDYKSAAETLPDSIISLYNIPDDFFEDNDFSQMDIPGFQAKQPENNASQEDASNNNFDHVDKDFYNDLSLDSYPFTQLKNCKCESDCQDVGFFLTKHESSSNISHGDVSNEMNDFNELSTEEELLMAEAAAVVEISFDESSFSENTIF